mgnify:CR=1 FL=1
MLVNGFTVVIEFSGEIDKGYLTLILKVLKTL